MESALDWVSPVIQLTTAGGFGALVWYLVIKHIPGIERRHKSERDEWLAYIQKRDQVSDGVARNYIESVASLRQDLQRIEVKIDEHAKS